MATTEEELPEELDKKLQITPNLLSQVKLFDNNLNIPLALNPFSDGDRESTTAQATDDQPSPTEPRPFNCSRCRIRRASESVLDELKHSSGPNTDSTHEYTRTPPNGGVLKLSLKKSTSSSAGTSGRKLLLREPVLKALQTCLHPQRNVRRKLISASGSTTGRGQVFDCSKQGSEAGPLTSKGMSDFRDLIDECRNLLAEDVDFSGRLNHICLSHRNSKNFTTMQTQQTQNISKLRNNRTYQKHQIQSRMRTEAGGCASDLNVEFNYHLNALAQPPLNLQRNVLSTTSSPEHASSSARCSTSCSQQAGNTAAAAAPSDDVTIDELASYFDTFVHIPKKMSSMAEMMYI